MNATKLVGGIIAAVILTFASRSDAEPRTHDGFQFRGGLGVGYLSDSESPSDNSFSGTISGLGASLDLFFGGTPVQGLTIGGFLNAQTAVGPSVSLNGQSLGSASSNVSLGLATLGPYVDYYVDPTQGLHFLALGGYASLSVSDGSGSSSNAGTGFALGAGVGYDFWVSDEWSIGVLGRFTYAKTSFASTGSISVSDSLVAPAILADVVYQ